MLSVVILTKNEEKNIIDCLESVSWVDEIIIVDDYSTDRTIEIINNLDNKKVKLFSSHLDLDFAKQKNFGLSKATKPWVLFIDSDERITKDLKEEINSIIINQNDKYAGYQIKRMDFMWGKMLKHGEVGDIKLSRLIKKGNGAWVGKVHENLIIDGNVGELDNPIYHYPHPTVSEFLAEVNFYSTIRAKELFEKKITTSSLHIIGYPLAKFILNYIFKLGFLDGIEGLILAIMMSFHSFLVRSKLWLLWQKKSSS